MLDDYINFLKELDKRLYMYFEEHAAFLCCKKGCSSCCEKGDYPISQIELEYLMQGFEQLDFDKRIAVQDNFKNIKKGGCCPFLINKECSVYEYRPLICRTHGLAYLCGDNKVKLPYCTEEGKNYSKYYKDGYIEVEPIKESLDTPSILKLYNPKITYPIRNLYDWINKNH